MRDTQRQRQRQRQREKQAPCREPDAGLDPGSPESGPGRKAGTKLPCTQGSQLSSFYLSSDDAATEILRVRE